MPRPAAQRIPIDDLNLPTYLQTVLRNGGLETARDLTALSEDDLRTMPGIAGTSIRRIKMALIEHGFCPKGAKPARGRPSSSR